MMIHRNRRKKTYANIDKDALQDQMLSWKARGLLCYLLSLPDDWEISFVHLIAQSQKDGKTAIQSAFKELLDRGYARREYRRNAANSRVAGTRYDIYEDRFSEEQVSRQSEILAIRNTESQKTPSLTNYLSETNYLGETKKKAQDSQKSLSPKNAPQRLAKSKSCPADWEPSPHVREWAATKFPLVDFDDALEAMRDYEFHTAHSDWNATLRTWIRRSVGRSNHQKPEPVANNRISEKGYRSAMAAKRVMEDIVNGPRGSSSLFQLPEHASRSVSD